MCSFRGSCAALQLGWAGCAFRSGAFAYGRMKHVIPFFALASICHCNCGGSRCAKRLNKVAVDHVQESSLRGIALSVACNTRHAAQNRAHHVQREVLSVLEGLGRGGPRTKKCQILAKPLTWHGWIGFAETSGLAKSHKRCRGEWQATQRASAIPRPTTTI
jgi:hypothetical protein